MSNRLDDLKFRASCLWWEVPDRLYEGVAFAWFIVCAVFEVFITLIALALYCLYCLFVGLRRMPPQKWPGELAGEVHRDVAAFRRQSRREKIGLLLIGLNLLSLVVLLATQNPDEPFTQLGPLVDAWFVACLALIFILPVATWVPRRVFAKAPDD